MDGEGLDHELLLTLWKPSQTPQNRTGGTVATPHTKRGQLGSGKVLSDLQQSVPQNRCGLLHIWDLSDCYNFRSAGHCAKEFAHNDSSNLLVTNLSSSLKSANRNSQCAFAQASWQSLGNFVNLVTRPKYPPLSRDRCSNTPVAQCFLWYRRLSLLHPQLRVLKNGLSQSKTGLTRGASQKKLASEAYRAIGGVAQNSIANRAIVGH